MSRPSLTPEEVVCQMSILELQELLGDLKMDSCGTAALRLQRLVQELGDFEQAVAILHGPAGMKPNRTAA
ncbi:MAG: hypothetical protein AB8B91_13005 [Rubripirellula sp.]